MAGLFLTTPLGGLALGLGFFIIVGIRGRLAPGLPAVWSTLDGTEPYVAIVVLGLSAFGALQFQVMLPMSEIRRSADAED